MTTVDLSGRGLGRLVPGSVGVAYGDRRPQWVWSRSAVKQSRSRTVLWPRTRSPSFYTTKRPHFLYVLPSDAAFCVFLPILATRAVSIVSSLKSDILVELKRECKNVFPVWLNRSYHT